ncbi:hypothetical protein B0H14DRAFT_2646730 [Mycena olivaceomarginata]|nr:hypothetical protein B0H14DRAFT_2646730 [Mycena olivaceomarginata]
MADDLVELASDSSALEESIVWQSFLEGIHYKVFAFSRVMRAGGPFRGFRHFGPKGHQLLASTINEVLDRVLHPQQIFQTLSSLVDTPQNWDKRDNVSPLISSQHFIDYILAPHAAASLISEDLEISFSDALIVLDESGDFGDYFNNLAINDGSASLSNLSVPRQYPQTAKSYTQTLAASSS